MTLCTGASSRAVFLISWRAVAAFAAQSSTPGETAGSKAGNHKHPGRQREVVAPTIEVFDQLPAIPDTEATGESGPHRIRLSRIRDAGPSPTSECESWPITTVRASLFQANPPPAGSALDLKAPVSVELRSRRRTRSSFGYRLTSRFPTPSKRRLREAVLHQESGRLPEAGEESAPPSLPLRTLHSWTATHGLGCSRTGGRVHRPTEVRIERAIHAASMTFSQSPGHYLDELPSLERGAGRRSPGPDHAGAAYHAGVLLKNDEEEAFGS